MAETLQCPNCGLANDISNSVCANCKTPLTAYAGQLTGEKYQGKLAAKVAAMDRRPVAVMGMTIFLLLFAVWWPLRTVIAAFMAKPHVNEEGTNYVGAAFGSIGPIFAAILFIPLTLVLCGIAWGVFTQKPWAWTASLGGLGIAVLWNVAARSGALSICMVIAALVLAFFWFQEETKAWYGLN